MRILKLLTYVLENMFCQTILRITCCPVFMFSFFKQYIQILTPLWFSDNKKYFKIKILIHFVFWVQSNKYFTFRIYLLLRANCTVYTYSEIISNTKKPIRVLENQLSSLYNR